MFRASVNRRKWNGKAKGGRRSEPKIRLGWRWTDAKDNDSNFDGRARSQTAISTADYLIVLDTSAGDPQEA